MLTFQGTLRKMSTQSVDGLVSYTLSALFENTFHTLELNPHLGKRITLQYQHQITCVGCSRPIKKSYQQGYCFPCTQKLAACDICIVKPERCHFHQGTCREPEWGLAHCFTPHIVYLSYTSNIKIGITRKTQVPTRWHDQGAIEALALFEVCDRRTSGLIEQTVAKWTKDKTHWKTMLTTRHCPENLEIFAKDLLSKLAQDSPIAQMPPPLDALPMQIRYPLIPEATLNLHSLSLDKTPTIEGVLLGIKGQYLLLDTGVVNIRKHTGYQIKASIA